MALASKRFGMIFTSLACLITVGIWQVHHATTKAQPKMEEMHSNQLAQATSMERRSMTIGNKGRTFEYFKPSTGRQQKLIIALHGGLGDGIKMARMTGINQLAQRYNYAVAYPNGVDQGRVGRWNDGRELNYRAGVVEWIDDKRFISDLISKLSTETGISLQNIYIIGGSNGGMMAQRMSCELDVEIGGIATVAASMPAPISRTCKPKFFIPIMMINGTDDAIVPFQGGSVISPRGGDVLSVKETINFWKDTFKCVIKDANAQPYVSFADIKSRVRVNYFQSELTQRTCVVEVTLVGGGHGWPTKTQHANINSGSRLINNSQDGMMDRQRRRLAQIREKYQNARGGEAVGYDATGAIFRFISDT